MNSHADIYNLILSETPTGVRLSRGTQSNLECLETGWVTKTDAPGEAPQVSWEFRVYCLLQDLVGPGVIAPEIDYSSSCEEAITISLVNNAASLEDYAVLFSTNGNANHQVWLELCREVGKLIARFHELGFIHGDLHMGNVVISLESGRLKPYLIDFGLTQHEELGTYPYKTVELNQDNDLDRLDTSLRNLSKDSRFLDGLEEIALAYGRF